MLTFFAHASTRDNEEGIRSGWNDPSLSEKGLEQARELRDFVPHLFFDCVYSSDLKRARQTAQIAFPRFDASIDPRLREMNYGVLNGRPIADFGNSGFDHIESPFPRGESCLDVENRVRMFLADCYIPNLRIAVVAHRFTQLSLEVILGDQSWQTAIDNDWRHHNQWRTGWHY